MSKPAPQIGLELLSHLSLRGMYRLGDALAFVVCRVPNQISRQVRENVALCFPGYDRSERRRLYRESIRQTCYTLVELAAVWCWPPERILERVTRSEVCDEFRSSKKGRIVLVPHLGSWETLALWLARQAPTTILYKRRKRRHRRVDDFVKQARERAGATLVPTKAHGLRKLLLDLKHGGSLMLLPDQKPAHNKARIASRFFGISAPTTTLVYNLCSKLDCDVFIATLLRSSPPGEFSLRIAPLESSRLAADDTESAQYMNDRIEQAARECLEQYQWGYRRFGDEAYAAAERD